MNWMETDTIKKPTIYKKQSQVYKDTINSIVDERRHMIARRNEAQARHDEITNQMKELEQQLERTIKKDERDSIKESMDALGDERDTLTPMLHTDVNAETMERLAEVDIESLKQKAKEENKKLLKELDSYWKQLSKTFRESKGNISYLQERNSYKIADEKFGNLIRNLERGNS